MAEKIRPIRSEEDYQGALARIEILMDALPGTDEADELEVLATLIELYEDVNFPINLPDPVTAIKFRMEQQGLSRKDLEGAIGHRGRISEVLSGKRSLTLEMIRKLHSQFKIPLEILINRPNTA